jgi:hypothetical protein
VKNGWMSTALAAAVLLCSTGMSLAQSGGVGSGGAGPTGGGNTGSITLPEQGPASPLPAGGAAGEGATLVVSPVVLGIGAAGLVAAAVVLATNSGHSVTTTTTTTKGQ